MMKRSIILEGPNGAGKSTLVHALSNALGMVYQHAGSDPGSTRNALKACAEQYMWIKGSCLVDRVTPISRQIYQNDLPIYEHAVLEHFLHIFLEEAVIVYCTAEGEFTNKDYYPEGHYDQVLRDREQIREEYDRFFETVPHIKYDWREKSVSDLIKEIADA